MKIITRLSLFILLILVLAFPAQALAAGSTHPSIRGLSDQFVFGDNYTLSSGSTLQGNLWVFGGNATLEQGSHVTGNVRLMGGTLHVDGQVDGNVAATGGLISLGDHALVKGDVDIMGASFDRAGGAQVNGQVNTEPRGPFELNTPTGTVNPYVPGVGVRLSPLWDFLGLLFRALLTAAIAVFAVRFAPRPAGRVTQTITTQPILSGLLGLLTVVVAPIVLVVIAITIILIPVSLLGILALAIMIVFGWVALGTEVGQRLAQAFKQEWAPPVAAGIGTFALTFVADGIGRYVACIGWLVPALIALVGLGAVVLTRFGTQIYPTYIPAPPATYPQVPPAEEQ